MANVTINGTTSNEYIKSRIVVTSTPNTASNSSNVVVSLQYKRTNSETTYGSGTFSITVDGYGTTSQSKQITITGSAWVEAVKKEFTVSHNNNGTKTIKVSASGSMPGTTLTYTSCGDTVSLDTIPRASSIDSVTNTTLGGTCRVYWTPKSSSYTYQLTFTLGSWTSSKGGIRPNTTSSYLYLFDVPLEVANQLTNVKTGTMTVTLYTFATVNAAPIGSDTKEFTVTVPDNSSTKPKVSMTIAPEHSLGNEFSGLYIQGKSKVKASVTGEGRYGATISSRELYVGGKNYSDPYISDYLSSSGTITIKARATDSRGYYNEDEKQITVLPYSNPLIVPASDENAIICARCDEDGDLSDSGTYLKIKARRSYSKLVSDGVQKNYCTVLYKYREESESDFTVATVILAEEATSDEIDLIIPNVTFYAEKSYVVQVGVSDNAGGNNYVQFIIPTEFVTADIPEAHRGKSIGIFRRAAPPENGENRIDIDGEVHGGALDTLTLGTMLTASATAKISLDDLKKPGCYYSPDKETTQHISGAPSNVNFGFGLEVRRMQSNSNIRQTLFYGITTWYRHWDGHSWSVWVSSLRGVSDSVTAQDFVVDAGTSSGWNYRLWNSGYAELWGVVTLSTYGDVRHIYANAGLPFPFTEYPTVTMTISRATAFSYLQGAIVLSEVYTAGSSTIKLMMIRDGGGLASGNTATVSVVIRGKYK